MKHLLLALVALITVACSAPIESRFTEGKISNRFSQEDIAAIELGLHTWDEATGGKVHFPVSVVDESEATIVALDRVPAPKGVVAAGSYGFNQLFMQKDVHGKTLTHVIIHEIGHTLGLNHAERGIMTIYANEQVCLDDSTLAAYCAVNDCSGVEMKPTCADSDEVVETPIPADYPAK